VLLVLVGSAGGEHHGVRAGLIKRCCVGCHRCQPSKYEASYNAKYSHSTKHSHILKLRHLISFRTGFEVMLAQPPRQLHPHRHEVNRTKFLGRIVSLGKAYDALEEPSWLFHTLLPRFSSASHSGKPRHWLHNCG